MCIADHVKRSGNKAGIFKFLSNSICMNSHHKTGIVGSLPVGFRNLTEDPDTVFRNGCFKQVLQAINTGMCLRKSSGRQKQDKKDDGYCYANHRSAGSFLCLTNVKFFFNVCYFTF